MEGSSFDDWWSDGSAALVAETKDTEACIIAWPDLLRCYRVDLRLRGVERLVRGGPPGRRNTFLELHRNGIVERKRSCA